jgi:S1-C subfamily serine protease
MFTPAKITATLLLTLVGGTFSASISAENRAVTPVAARVSNQPNELPKLGFDSQMISGYGEQVTFVEQGSKAFRLGMQQNDVVLSVNGVRLTHRDAWQTAIANAVGESRGSVTLKIRVARTGAVVERHTNLLN